MSAMNTPSVQSAISTGLTRTTNPFTSVSISLMLLFFMLLLPENSLHAETYVSGEVSGTWNVEGSPYIVTGDISVDDLNIEPGTEILFQADETELNVTVNGRIWSNGIEGDSVYFRCFDGNLTVFYTIEENCEMPSIFRYSRMEGQFRFTIDDESNLQFRHCFLPNQAASSLLTIEGGLDTQLLLDNTTAFLPVFSIYTHGLTEIRNSIIDNRMGTNLCLYGGAEIDSSFLYMSSLTLGGDVELTNSTIPYINLNTINGIIDNCHIRYIYTEQYQNRSVVAITNCLFSAVDEDYPISQARPAQLSLRNQELTFINNIVDGCSNFENIDEGSSIIYNEFRNYTELENCNCLFANNTVVWKQTPLFHEEEAILFEGGGTPTVVNNLVIGQNDHLPTYGMTFDDVNAELIRSNWFYRVGQMINGPNPGILTSRGNPRVVDLENEDYRLQAVSPLRDTGYTYNGSDDDQTQPDIGAHWFDSRENYPPVFDSEKRVLAFIGQEFSYVARVSDDENSLQMNIQGFPEWLTVEEFGDDLDETDDSLRLVGTAPNDAEDFTFQVQYSTLEDGAFISEVAVTMCKSLVEGELTGHITTAESPVYVANNVVVPDGSQLTVDPGVEFLFRSVGHADSLLSFTVHGDIIIQGEPSDSIIFMGALDESSLAWRGLVLEQGDRAVFDFVVIKNAQTSIEVMSQPYENVTITNSRLSNDFCALFINNIDSLWIQNSTLSEIYYYCVLSYNVTNVIIKNCLFKNIFQHDAIGISNSSNTIIDSCSFIDAYNSLSIDIYDDISDSNVIFQVSNNHIHGAQRGIVVELAEDQIEYDIVINKNIIDNTRFMITIDNNAIANANYEIYNNTFVGGYEGLSLPNEHASFMLYNNIFDTNIYAFSVGDDSLPEIDYNVFSNIGRESETARALIDAGVGNQRANPLFVNAAGEDYRLLPDSPCIDAGDPNSPLDPDGTRSDIGALPYDPTWEAPELEEAALPTEDALLPGYPNPFNSTVMVPVELRQPGHVTLSVFNILGQQVARQSLGQLSAGRQLLSWNSTSQSDRSVSSGVYFVRVEITRNNSASYQGVQKVILLQ